MEAGVGSCTTAGFAEEILLLAFDAGGLADDAACEPDSSAGYVLDGMLRAMLVFNRLDLLSKFCAAKSRSIGPLADAS